MVIAAPPPTPAPDSFNDGCTNNDMGYDTVEERKEANGGERLLLVEEEVLMNLKGALHKDNYATNGKSGDEDGSDICEEDDENREAMRPHKVWVSKNVWLKMTNG
ncbi:hypothetical protein ACFX2K_001305 [Malus domestica]